MLKKIRAERMNEMRKVNLVATYEEHFHVPFNKRMTLYFGDYGMHFKRNEQQGFNEIVFEDRYQNALNFTGLTERELFENEEFSYRGKMVELFNKVQKRLDKVAQQS